MEELKGSKPDTCRQTSVGKISRSPLHVHRYVILIFLSLLNFGSNFVYDNPVALQDTIINVSTCSVCVSRHQQAKFDIEVAGGWVRALLA